MDKELIAHITQQLKKHKEPYTEGAWERFTVKQEKKKQTLLWWSLGSAAAVVLVFCTILFSVKIDKKESLVSNRIQNIHETIAKLKSNNQKKTIIIDQSKNTIFSPLTNRDQKLAKTNFSAKTKVHLTDLSQNYIDADQAKKTTEIASNLDQKNNQHKNETNQSNIDNHPVIAQNHKSRDSSITSAPTKLTFEEILANDSKKDNQIKTKTNKTNKWQTGIFVAPSIGSANKLNVDYGFSLAYNVANKISINSGISYNSISAQDQTNANVPQTFATKSLQLVKANLSGINIPVEVKYNITDKFYTGIGVSALAVLNTKQENDYVSNEIQNISVATTNGALENKAFIVKQKTSESVPAAEQTLDKYIGFYNFSLGYKQKIAKKTNIAIEPFLRLPMKTVSQESLNLTNGGLRIKFDF